MRRSMRHLPGVLGQMQQALGQYAWKIEDALVATYWRYYELSTSSDRAERLASADLSWAFDRVDQMAKDGEPGVIDVLVALSDAAKDDAARAYLGAGPVENFVRRHRQRFQTEFEAASRQSPSLMEVLRYVWGGPSR